MDTWTRETALSLLSSYEANGTLGDKNLVIKISPKNTDTVTITRNKMLINLLRL